MSHPHGHEQPQPMVPPAQPFYPNWEGGVPGGSAAYPSHGSEGRYPQQPVQPQEHYRQPGGDARPGDVAMRDGDTTFGPRRQTPDATPRAEQADAAEAPAEQHDEEPAKQKERYFRFGRIRKALAGAALVGTVAGLAGFGYELQQEKSEAAKADPAVNTSQYDQQLHAQKAAAAIGKEGMALKVAEYSFALGALTVTSAVVGAGRRRVRAFRGEEGKARRAAQKRQKLEKKLAKIED